MKRFAVLLMAAAFVGAQAQQGAPADVPRGHWAYAAVDALFRAGLLKGYPDGTFKGSRPASRYELAGALNSVNQDLQSRIEALKPRSRSFRKLGRLNRARRSSKRSSRGFDVTWTLSSL